MLLNAPKWAFFVCTGIILVACLVILKIHISPWYIWELLPNNSDIKVLSNFHGSSKKLISSQLSITPFAPAKNLFDQTSILAFSSIQQGSTLILTPRYIFSPPSQTKLRQQLEAGGWTTYRHGLIIIATQGNATFEKPSAFKTGLGAIQSISKKSLPKNPSLYGRVVSSRAPLFDQDINLIALTEKLEGLTSLKLDIFTDQGGGINLSGPQMISSEELSVSLPGASFSALPETLRATWNKSIRDKLGFVKVKADITSEFTTANQVKLLVQNDQAGISAISSSPSTSLALRQQLISYVQQEEAYLRPVAKAFKLPDGTIGYERVPGLPQDVFSLTPDEHGCHSPIENRTKLWLCQREENLVIATSKELSLKLIDGTERGSWHISVGSNHTESLQPSRPFGISATGEENKVNIRISF